MRFIAVAIACLAANGCYLQENCDEIKRLNSLPKTVQIPMEARHLSSHDQGLIRDACRPYEYDANIKGRDACIAQKTQAAIAGRTVTESNLPPQAPHSNPLCPGAKVEWK